MLNYFKNLLKALLGINPYRMEMEWVQREYDLTVKAFNELKAEKEKNDAELAAAKKSNANYQNLTENLRDRVQELKNELTAEQADRRTSIIQMKDEYEAKVKELRRKYECEKIDMHEDYERRLNGLREDLDKTTDILQASHREIANDLMAQRQLAKTNGDVYHLCEAMASGDAEKMEMATQYLDWNKDLMQIAKYHLQVLLRKQELEERG